MSNIDEIRDRWEYDNYFATEPDADEAIETLLTHIDKLENRISDLEANRIEDIEDQQKMEAENQRLREALGKIRKVRPNQLAALVIKEKDAIATAALEKNNAD